MNAKSCARPPPGPEFRDVIAAAKAIRQKTEDKMMYDQREKAQRDYRWAINSAREAGRKEGLEQVRKEAREQAREQARKEAREQARKEAREFGIFVGKIELLRELLGEDAGSKAELLERSIEELSAMCGELQQRLKSRNDGG